MNELPPDDDRQWQEFLRQNCPTPPPESADLEEQLMKAVAKSPQLEIDRRLWAWPPALAAGLLMLLSSYRLLLSSPEPSNSASLEAFLQDNWNQVMGEIPPSSPSNRPPSSPSNSVPVEWRVEAYATQ